MYAKDPCIMDLMEAINEYHQGKVSLEVYNNDKGQREWVEFNGELPELFQLIKERKEFRIKDKFYASKSEFCCAMGNHGPLVMDGDDALMPIEVGDFAFTCLSADRKIRQFDFTEVDEKGLKWQDGHRLGY